MMFNRIQCGLFMLGLCSFLMFGCSNTETDQNSTKDNSTNQNSTKENNTDQNSTDQNSTKDNNTDQNSTEQITEEPKSDITIKELDELEGVWIETEYETYEVGTTSVRVKWYNTLPDSMLFGEMFYLEENVNGSWDRVSKVTDINYGFNAVGLILNPNDSRWHNYNLICYTDGLALGEYRISATFVRETLDGVDYGAGNYPEYQVYGYFNVGDKSVPRNMSELDDLKIEFINDKYHFSIYLPKEWEGYQVITEQETGDKESDELFRNIDNEYIVMTIRHPNWTKEEPYQDISLVIFRMEQWNNNVNDATGDDYDLLPHMVPGGDGRYLITINPAAYDDTLRRYDEVMKIIGNEYSDSSFRDY